MLVDIGRLDEESIDGLDIDPGIVDGSQGGFRREFDAAPPGCTSTVRLAYPNDGSQSTHRSVASALFAASARRTRTLTDLFLVKDKISIGKTLFRADAGALPATERHARIPRLDVVDPHVSSLEALRRPQCAVEVICPYAGTQPVSGAVGDRDRFVLRGEGQRGQYRSEDLVTREPGAGVDIVEDRRLKECAVGELGCIGDLAANDEPCALFGSSADELHDSLPMRLCDQ